MAHGFAYAPPYTLTPAQPPAGISYPPASPHCLTTTHQVPSHTTLARRSAWRRRLAQRGSSGSLIRGYGNINPLSIDYASRPRLRSRLTQGGLAWPWNPWSFGGRVSHPSFATHACILTRWRSTPDHSEASQHHRRSPTAPACAGTHSFGSGLESRYIIRAGSLDQ